MKNLNFLFTLVLTLAFVSCDKQPVAEYVTPQPEVKEVTTLITQTKELHEGWNGISFYVEAEDMNAVSIFNQIADVLTIVKTTQQDGGSGVLWYLQGGDTINTLGDINCHYGYQLHVTEDCIIQLSGTLTIDTLINVTEFEGWKMCGVPFNHEKKVSDLYVFPNPPGQYDIAKNIPLGTIYWPALNINQIVNLHPGSAYLVNYREQKGENREIFEEIISSKNGVVHCFYDKNGNLCDKKNAFVEVQDNGVTFLNNAIMLGKYRVGNFLWVRETTTK